MSHSMLLEEQLTSTGHLKGHAPSSITCSPHSSALLAPIVLVWQKVFSISISLHVCLKHTWTKKNLFMHNCQACGVHQEDFFSLSLSLASLARVIKREAVSSSIQIFPWIQPQFILKSPKWSCLFWRLTLKGLFSGNSPSLLFFYAASLFVLCQWLSKPAVLRDVNVFHTKAVQWFQHANYRPWAPEAAKTNMEISQISTCGGFTGPLTKANCAGILFWNTHLRLEDHRAQVCGALVASAGLRFIFIIT